MTDLCATLANDVVRLEPFADQHVEPLRQACAADPDIWQIYPINLTGEHFEPSLAGLRGQDDWAIFAVLNAETGELIGMTSYIRPTPHGVVEIGATFIHPDARGTGLNRAVKTLLIEHAFSSDFVKIEFRVDTRNARSMAAVEKLGAQYEGTIRQNMVTWTGYRRDTAIYGLLKTEWAG